MIDGLVSGKLYGTATSRTGASGKAFVTAKMRAAVGDGESLFVNVIAFSTTAGDALLALGDGDSLALAGTLTPKVWTDKGGNAKPALDIVAHAVLSVYAVKHRRDATQSARRRPETLNGAEQARDSQRSRAGPRLSTEPSRPETLNGAEQARRMYGGADMNDDL